MNCPSCGLKAGISDIFCEDCGYQFIGGESSLPPATAPIECDTTGVNPYGKKDFTSDTLLQHRLPAPRKNNDKKQKPAMVLPEGFILEEKYRLSFYTVGGMCTVYQAIDVMTNLKYIIKEAYSTDIEEKEIMTMALLKERDILARIEHPGIVKALDLFQYLGTYYLVLEYVQGKNLEAYASNISKHVEEKEVLDWAIQLCSILDYLHNISPPIIYRDLKPENVIVDIFGRVKLIDFGIARSFKEYKSKDTVAIGTPGFAAPEQYGKKQTDFRADIYSLGATMHFLLTGSDPRERENPFLFPPILNENVRVSPLTRETIHKAVHVKRECRYQSAGELREDLISAIEMLKSKTALVKHRDYTSGYSISTKEIHPGVLSFVLPILTSFITVFCIGFLPVAFLSPFIVGFSFIAGTILGFKGIIRDIKTQSYGMLVISILGTAINLFPTLVVGFILVAILIFGFL